MNIHESEKIAGTLRAMGYVECDDENQADVIVFNTCCIRDNAEKRALGNIGAFKHFSGCGMYDATGRSRTELAAKISVRRYSFGHK